MTRRYLFWISSRLVAARAGSGAGLSAARLAASRLVTPNRPERGVSMVSPPSAIDSPRCLSHDLAIRRQGWCVRAATTRSLGAQCRRGAVEGRTVTRAFGERYEGEPRGPGLCVPASREKRHRELVVRAVVGRLETKHRPVVLDGAERIA